ncbi:LysR family transcriptional regulator [[Limnothrix rosea] IAM M-220]|uniref:LysR family transcriptional regulator n=1 Tax=[Limnothrix rosea] IAM M-220 TaxID=454133 RepID=UPI00096979F4|nr:LysR family transcriptional regulator [[Limnothrix rosea] IAM M-220]OKH16898.1 LysR family transcriptional regulator [[Limnothrix rosea] IAM M-220]
MNKLESMSAFVRVVEEGSFAAAARKMLMGRSAVNKMVVALENSLKVQLLHRSTRKVTPTPTGLAFYEKCLQILADIEEAELSVSRSHGEPQGLLRVNAPMTFGTMCFAPVLADFMNQYPQLQVQLTLEDRFVDAIAEGFDLLIRVAEPTASASLISHELFQTQVLLCASPAYLGRSPHLRTPEDLKNHNCLLYGYQQTKSQWQIGAESVTVSGSFCSNNGEALAIAAKKGLGVALLPCFIVDSYLKSGALKMVLPDYCQKVLTVSVLYPINRHLSTKVKLFTEFLIEQFEGDRP